MLGMELRSQGQILHYKWETSNVGRDFPQGHQAESSRSDYCFHPFPDHALHLESLSPK